MRESRSLRDVKEYLLMVALSTHPLRSCGYGDTSVPPPAKLMRTGALLRKVSILDF